MTCEICIHCSIPNYVVQWTLAKQPSPICKSSPLIENPQHQVQLLGIWSRRTEYVETDPFEMLSPWQQLLKNWNASPSQIQYRLMLAYTPPGLTQIYDRKSAENWRQKEEYEWTGGWRMDDRLAVRGSGVQNRSSGKEFLDLTKYWPEIALLSLP